MRKLLAGLLLSSVVLLGTAHASSEWTKYSNKDAGKIKVLIVKASCLEGEDSAAHLRLLGYGHGKVRYGCFRKGY